MDCDFRPLASLIDFFEKPFSPSGHENKSRRPRPVVNPQVGGKSPAVVRLCFGLEDEEDLRADLAQAFASLERGRRAVRARSAARRTRAR